MRIDRLKKELEEGNQLPYIVFSLKNIFYLTGITASNAYMIIDRDAAYFITDSRYEEYAKSLLPSDVQFVLQKGSFQKTLSSFSDRLSSKDIHLEKHALILSLYLELQKSLPGYNLLPSEDVVNNLRIQKDSGEIDLIRRAANLADSCMGHVKCFLKEGVSEWEIALEIEMFYKRNGCKSTSFDSIVAFGANSSMPHYQTSERCRLKYGDPVLVDMGCVLDGYCSDITRTLFFGMPDQKVLEIYNVVKDAQVSALNSVKAGMVAGELDSVARNYISQAGYGDYFGHSLGHGVGIDVHELPSVNSESDKVLLPESIITIEPGIYLPGVGGVRIEDMVRVTETGFEVLTHFPKELIVVE